MVCQLELVRLGSSLGSYQVISQPIPNSQSQQPSAQQIQQFLPMMQMMGDRIANGGGGGGSNTPPRGTSSSLDIRGSGGTGPGGVSLQNVNACSNQPGKFSFKFGHHPEAGCDGELKMHEDLATFISNNFGRCVSQAAGVNSFEKGKVHHAGTMGDAKHQRTKSLHNYGLAIDINTIEIDGRVFTYADRDETPGAAQFFEKLRKCWGDAAQRERNGCLPERASGMPHGSIGHEDHNHQNHLHLSLPMCRDVAGGAYIAQFWEMLLSAAHAAEKLDKAEEEKLLPPPSKFERYKVKFPNGVAEVVVEDTGGEPIGADHIISLTAKCNNGKAAAPNPFGKIEACEFIEARYNKKARAVEAIYKSSRMTNGRVACDKVDTAQAKVKCD